MPPKRRVSSRKRHRSPGVSPASRPTQAARLDNDDPVLSPVPEAGEPQGGPAGAGAEDCVYAEDDSHNVPGIHDQKLTERQLRLNDISENISQYYFALQEAKETLGADSLVVKVLTKVKDEACDLFKRVDAEGESDGKVPGDDVPEEKAEEQAEVPTLLQRQMNLESELFLLRANVFPMIEDLEKRVLALREEIEERQE
ncbi:uncharacterized protein FFUJ_14164 [Fusarium fujikuroi IMI 58289]|uniref:Uncharacterized protein n=1 Tax=Gibberella fujikuroi (strain CBS 195.34 / IMI 58289 / NRRL A-6831) TaxID=1279085 RepID=S0EMB9_GIBF5|nr:uncharacterized protein FFUJ_14164 [Fusarium fujikuroi IMI 58289]CCT76203.1 uncharacterized protein FFUJ_14164 [Fusarium fujikuroi IMI 58289]SCO26772.1 uncharacterized protein FFM5_15041 [Fusarium fujikuroi]